MIQPHNRRHARKCARALTTILGTFDQLAVYNAECNRGIKHSAAWQERMATEQMLFDTLSEAREWLQETCPYR
jgi:hypothetical protein